MGDLFWNKVAGAVLATALGVLGIRALGHALIHSPVPEVPGYKVATAQEEIKAAKKVKAAPVLSLAQLLSTAKASSGERVSKKCSACHDLSKGGPDRIGPNLWDVVGRKAASHEGFKYSQAMQDFGGQWTYANIDEFLTSPKTFVAGTAMGFAGLKKPKDRASLLAYLRTLSDAPVPLPVTAALAADTAAAAQAVQQAAADAPQAVVAEAADTIQDAAKDAVANVAASAKDATAGVAETAKAATAPVADTAAKASEAQDKKP